MAVSVESPSHNGYYKKEWAEKITELGLMPSHIGKLCGKKTGRHMTHYIIKGENYDKAFKPMQEKFILPFASLNGDLMKGQD